MPFRLTIPQSDDSPLELMLNQGETLFVLGANGTGKSGLMHSFYRVHRDSARRITAHRRTWLDSNAINLSPMDRRDTERNIQSTDNEWQARWQDNYSAQRASIAIYDLIDAENVRARAITKAVDDKNFELAQSLSKEDAPIKVINEILRLSNIPIEISVKENEEVIASKLQGAPYSIAELSDGERNALLISASVLTAKQGTLILIDEPERHLHRSIISPLLTLLFGKRPDCAFVISTHEVMLPLDNPRSQTLLLRGCTYRIHTFTAWDADLVCPGTEIDDDLKRDILGARRNLLFVEGTEQSLDKSLYSLVFPEVSVIAKVSCRDVEYAVSGIRDASGLHWLQAFGIVDNDRRTSDDIDQLKQKGVYAIPVFSVESIYYHPEIQLRVAQRHSAITGEDASARCEEAKAAALAAIIPHVQHLSERVVEKALREKIFQQLPRRKDLAAAKPICISIDGASNIAAECHHLQSALDRGNLVEIITHYPVRETPALDEIAKKLGFTGRRQYESAVRKLLMDDEEALGFVRGLFGTLASDISAA